MLGQDALLVTGRESRFGEKLIQGNSRPKEQDTIRDLRKKEEKSLIQGVGDCVNPQLMPINTRSVNSGSFPEIAQEKNLSRYSTKGRGNAPIVGVRF